MLLNQLTESGMEKYINILKKLIIYPEVENVEDKKSF